jgi:hypothetical protein
MPAQAWLWLVLLALLLLLLWLLLIWFRRRHGAKEHRKHRCIEIPPDVARRPDPCLYSQPYLMAKGLAVTWDNPDIRITTPGGVLVPSSSLAANTDYLVEATIHNASFDAALSVEVRCFYRPWSFGTPDRVPVEVDSNGEPAVRILHIGAWGQALAKFKWRTPNVANAHFCLQVECFHPADREPNNNLGQENTQVSGAASDVELVIPLFNFRRRHQDVLIAANEYAIPRQDVALSLRQIRGYRGAEPALLAAPKGEAPDARDDGDARKRAVERDAIRGSRIRLSPEGRRASRGVGYRVFGYEGFERLAQGNALQGARLTEGWTLEVGDAVRDEQAFRLQLPPGASKNVKVRIHVPDATPAGRRKAVNIWAADRFGALLGGVTVYVTKEA